MTMVVFFKGCVGGGRFGASEKIAALELLSLDSKNNSDIFRDEMRNFIGGMTFDVPRCYSDPAHTLYQLEYHLHPNNISQY